MVHRHRQLLQIQTDRRCHWRGPGPVPDAYRRYCHPGLVSLFGGDSYSFGLSSTPVKGLILSGSWCQGDQQHHQRHGHHAAHLCQPEQPVQYATFSISFASCTSPADMPAWSRVSAGRALNRKSSLRITWGYHVGSTSSKPERCGRSLIAQPWSLAGAVMLIAVCRCCADGRQRQGEVRGSVGSLGDVARRRPQPHLGAQLPLRARSQTQSRFLEQAGRRRRRRSGVQVPGASLQHRHRFARPHHRHRSGRRRRAHLRLRRSTSTSSSSATERRRDARPAMRRRRCPGQHLRHRFGGGQDLCLRARRQVSAHHRQLEGRRRLLQAAHRNCRRFGRTADLRNRHAARQGLRARHAGQRLCRASAKPARPKASSISPPNCGSTGKICWWSMP